MRGLVATPMETLDQFITGEVTNHLFEDRKIPFSGVDLIALNIQRGIILLYFISVKETKIIETTLPVLNRSRSWLAFL